MAKYYTENFINELEQFTKVISEHPSGVIAKNEIEDISDRDYLRLRIALLKLTLNIPDMLQNFVGTLDLRAYDRNFK